jgi:hypothetical protein
MLNPIVGLIRSAEPDIVSRPGPKVKMEKFSPFYSAKNCGFRQSKKPEAMLL